jgi:regulator of sigma E protease
MGGIIVNVITAFLIYGMILFVWGETKIVNSSVKNGIAVGDSLMYSIGFRDGDKIKSVDGETIQYFDDVLKKVIIKGEEAKVTVERNGAEQLVTVPKDILGQLSTKKIDRKGLINFRMPAIVDSMDEKVVVKSNAFKAGILPNDKIIKLDSTVVNYWDNISSYTEKQKAGAEIAVTVLRGSEEKTLVVKLDENQKLGIAPLRGNRVEAIGWFASETKKYGFFESFPAGVKKTFEKLSDYIGQFALIFKPSTGAYKGMGGFASMTQVFGTSWDWQSFWSITAFFSIVLAFMNFLPIPMLDGGYILFTLFEIIFRRKVPDRFLEKANLVGFIIIIGLMVFTNGNDIFRKFMGWF